MPFSGVPTAAADPRVGMMLEGRYRITARIAMGGMATVYAAEHLRIKRKVAIKVLHTQFAENAEVVARFQREAEAAGALGHPHIIDVLDMGSLPDGTSYLVLELLEGRDFGREIEAQGAQPLGKVAHVVTQACEALAAVHDRGIVHRDIKPDNLFLIRRGGDPCFVKVLDFGVSKILAAQDAGLTRTGVALGTPYYMAPEQCSGAKDIDLRCDIYALGVVMFKALTTQYPFDDEAYPMLVLKICTQTAPSILEFRSDLPAEVDAIVRRMMARDPRDRFASCDDVRAALLPYCESTMAPALRPDAPRTIEIVASMGLSTDPSGASGEIATTIDVPELERLEAWRLEAERRGELPVIPDPSSRGEEAPGVSPSTPDAAVGPETAGTAEAAWASAPDAAGGPEIPETAWLSAAEIDAALIHARAQTPLARAPIGAPRASARPAWLLPALGVALLVILGVIVAVVAFLAS